MDKCEKLAHSLSSKERTRDVLLSENIYFSSLILPAEILKALTDAGFEKPSPIQVKALPIGRCGLGKNVNILLIILRAYIFWHARLDFITS